MTHIRRYAGVLLARRVLPRVLGLMRLVLPSRQHVVVCGFPEVEGNAVEVVRALSERYDGAVVWLRHPSVEFIERVGIDLTRFQLLDRRSPLAMWRFVTAEAVFFTHGLYGEPSTTPRKPTINLWHGAGPKRMGKGLFPERHLGSPPQDNLVSISRLWGEYYAGLSATPTAKVLVTGHPRNDAMFQGELVDRCSKSLGGRFVLWTPAYRSTAGRATMTPWSDVTGAGHVPGLPRGLLDGLTSRGYKIVVKPHPLDAERYDQHGLTVVDDDWLHGRGFLLGHVMAASSALITDYSSASTDYVLLDRAIAFSIPDLDAYAAGRGLHPSDYVDWLPGTDVGTPEGVTRFLRDVAADGAMSRPARVAFMRHAELTDTRTSAHDLLDALSSGTSRFANRVAGRPQANSSD